MQRVRVQAILDNFAPGSGLSTWDEEWRWIENSEDSNLKRVKHKVKKKGIGFADETDPITLGPDDRVWDGHHRLYLAHTLGIRLVNVKHIPHM